MMARHTGNSPTGRAGGDTAGHYRRNAKLYLAEGGTQGKEKSWGQRERRDRGGQVDCQRRPPWEVCDVTLSFVSSSNIQEINITSQCFRSWVVLEVM